jgi:hypothetical protein
LCPLNSIIPRSILGTSLFFFSFLLAEELPVLAPLLLIRAGSPLLLDAPDDGGPALLPVEQLVDLLRENLACFLAVLVAGACGLGFDDDAGWSVAELDGGVCFVLFCLSVSTMPNLRRKGTQGGLRQGDVLSFGRLARCL